MSQQQESVLAKNFSTALIAARAGRSQAEFARYLGIKHQQTYQNYEAGRIPDGETLHRIATKLGTTVDRLLGGMTEIQEDVEFLAIITLFCEAMTAKQLLEVMKQITGKRAISDRNAVFWVKVIGEWALIKMELEEKAAQQARK